MHREGGGKFCEITCICVSYTYGSEDKLFVMPTFTQFKSMSDTVLMNPPPSWFTLGYNQDQESDCTSKHIINMAVE